MANPEYDVEKQEAQTPERVERARPARVFTPRVDIRETKETIVVEADMPGVAEEDIDITLEQNVLTLRGTVQDHAPEGYACTYREYAVGDYERAFTITEDVDRDRIDATMKNGVLTLTLPKARPEPAKKISVKSASG
jgi:HSP20 family molecular chaperone IbpA